MNAEKICIHILRHGLIIIRMPWIFIPKLVFKCLPMNLWYFRKWWCWGWKSIIWITLDITSVAWSCARNRKCKQLFTYVLDKTDWLTFPFVFHIWKPHAQWTALDYFKATYFYAWRAGSHKTSQGCFAVPYHFKNRWLCSIGRYLLINNRNPKSHLGERINFTILCKFCPYLLDV